MSTADEQTAPDPNALDAVLTILARHARELAPLGGVRLAAGPVSLELGAAPAPTPTPTTAPVPAIPLAPPTTHLAAVPDEPAAPVGPTVCATTVGVFYRATEPAAAPFVTEGDTVAVGQQIGIVEAMKLMIPLESDRAGTVEEFLVGDGDAVEHGQPVLRLSAP